MLGCGPAGPGSTWQVWPAGQSPSTLHALGAQRFVPATPAAQKQSSPLGQSPSSAQPSTTHARTGGPGFGLPGPTHVGVCAQRGWRRGGPLQS